MRKTINYYFFLAISLLSFSACDVSESGDDWTPVKTIKLGDVSIMVPETYTTSTSNSSRLVVDNGIDGSGSVEINMESINGRTDSAIFADREEYLELYSYTIISTSDTTLLNIPAKKIESTFPLVINTVGLPTIDFIFTHNGYAYTLEFSWSQIKDTKSRILMTDMLKTLQISN